MSDFSKAVIYKLYCKDYDKIYIGSTTQDLKTRFWQHKSEATRKASIKSHELFNRGEEVLYEVIEEYPCNNKRELHRREGEIIRENIDICLNIAVPTRTRNEWKQDNKERETIKRQEYYEKRKELWDEKVTCECGRTLTRGHLKKTST